MLKCPKCDLKTYVKAGISWGKQRYKCKECRCFFTRSSIKGYDFETKIQAMKLFKEELGFRAIGRTLGVSFQTVTNWIRDFGKNLKNSIEIKEECDIVEVDELCTFLKREKIKSGFGLLLIKSQEKFLVFHLKEEGLKPQKDYSPR